MSVLAIAGPGLVADLDLVREILAIECEALGVAGRLVVAGSVAAAKEALAQADAGAIVVLPSQDPGTRRLMTMPGSYQDRTVWCDLERTGPVEVAGGGAHMYGRGIWGVAWAIRHAVHRSRHPARRVPYGPHPDQWGELRLPPPAAPPAGLPVAVLVHGGYWRSVWAADLMDALAIDLARRGFASWNLEYRRPDGHGWDATTSDVASGLAALAGFAAELDVARVAVIGHSAGGQLALRAAADSRVALAVSLAGVVDLAQGHRRGVGTGAVEAALGGSPDALPDRYAASDPMARLPLRVPQLVVQGRDDDPDLVDCGRRYAVAARAAGDELTYLERSGGHFAVIDPTSPIWLETAGLIEDRLQPQRAS